jgi:hypothetical protein
MKSLKKKPSVPSAAISVRDHDKAIQMANDTEFGLAGYFYSRDIGRIGGSRELVSGMVGINTGLISNDHTVWGVKQSGLGREGSHYGIEEFVEVKIPLFRRTEQLNSGPPVRSFSSGPDTTFAGPALGPKGDERKSRPSAWVMQNKRA